MTNVQEFSDRLIENIENVIVGKRETVEFAVITLLCQGHLLIDDVPGVGNDNAGTQRRPFDRLFLQPHPVHAGHAAQRCDRRLDLQPGQQRV